jgi:hypothetical protein
MVALVAGTVAPAAAPVAAPAAASARQSLQFRRGFYAAGSRAVGGIFNHINDIFRNISGSLSLTSGVIPGVTVRPARTFSTCPTRVKRSFEPAEVLVGSPDALTTTYGRGSASGILHAGNINSVAGPNTNMKKPLHQHAQQRIRAHMEMRKLGKVKQYESHTPCKTLHRQQAQENIQMRVESAFQNFQNVHKYGDKAVRSSPGRSIHKMDTKDSKIINISDPSLLKQPLDRVELEEFGEKWKGLIAKVATSDRLMSDCFGGAAPGLFLRDKRVSQKFEYFIEKHRDFAPLVRKWLGDESSESVTSGGCSDYGSGSSGGVQETTTKLQNCNKNNDMVTQDDNSDHALLQHNNADLQNSKSDLVPKTVVLRKSDRAIVAAFRHFMSIHYRDQLISFEKARSICDFRKPHTFYPKARENLRRIIVS